ncbi:YbbR-like domain-containing protein [Aquimarina sp. 2201CG14-23]|uniref:YbbR-like domain-containing protein n=1 Tax=Aquimarina mycalae TaxID=3040073 RepID=UPI002477FBA1|nr:YbbR-like domain-containing protein [Aquimarina sp. 2201CG14-23]MDH7448274.1 YbbR-like domain-containing protein [Aquimarina sp. 2201CG14-23]
MSKTKLNRFSLKRNNVKTFLFFLAFTSLLWLLIQFSKNYTKEVEVAIHYTNLPEDRILHDESDQTLKLTLNGNGFRLINHSWSKPLLQFDVSDAVAADDDEYYFLIDQGGQLLKEKLDFNGRILSFRKDTLQVKLDVNLEKKIPIRLVKEIDYVPGYGSDKGVVLSPDSIVISGPKRIVDTIHYVVTENLKFEGLNTNNQTTLPIKIDSLPARIKVLPKEVEASIEVSKFTEGSQEIPITLINVPEGKEIKIFPKEVRVVYRVGLDKYNEINLRDFKVIADYNKVSEDSSFLILELVDMPSSSIHDVRLQDKQVQFVILN